MLKSSKNEDSRCHLLTVRRTWPHSSDGYLSAVVGPTAAAPPAARVPGRHQLALLHRIAWISSGGEPKLVDAAEPSSGCRTQSVWLRNRWAEKEKILLDGTLKLFQDLHKNLHGLTRKGHQCQCSCHHHNGHICMFEAHCLHGDAISSSLLNLSFTNSSCQYFRGCKDSEEAGSKAGSLLCGAPACLCGRSINWLLWRPAVLPLVLHVKPHP